MKKIIALVMSAIMLVSMLTMIPFSSSAEGWDGETAVEFTGKGTASDPYIIASAENLKYLQLMVDDGEDYSGEYFTQTADIDLNGKEWNPIGENNTLCFSGVYDGLGHSINGLYISQAKANYIGLFAVIQSTYFSEAGVMNLTLNGEIVIDNFAGDYGIGALCGYVYKDGDDGFQIQKIYNVTSNVNFTIDAKAKQPRLGGLFGWVINSEVFNCVNNGTINYIGTGHSRIGGIAGQSNRTHFKNCVNNGYIKAVLSEAGASQIGGMCGMTTFKKQNVLTEYDHCINNGKIEMVSENGHCMGSGICGSLYSSGAELYLSVHDCVNNGEISAKVTGTDNTRFAWASGICPRVNVGVSTIENNYNTSLDIISEGPAGDSSAGIVAAITAGSAENVIIKNNVTVTPKAVGTSVFEVAENLNTAYATDADYKAKVADIMEQVDAKFDAVICDFPGSGAAEETTAEETTEEVTTPVVTTAEITNAEVTSADVTSPVETTAAEKTADTTKATEEPKKSSCGSSICAGVAILALLGSAICFKKH